MTHLKSIAQTSQPTRGSSPCATILLSVSGPALHIACGLLADVYISKPIRGRGSHYWFPLTGPSDEERRANIFNLARIVPAVRTAIRNLRSPATRPAPYLPYPTAAHPLDQKYLRNLQFEDRLSRDVSRSLFRANAPEGNALVKFCGEYDPRAHNRLARHNLAPQLFHVANLVDGLKMVVMAFNPRMTSAYDKYFGRELPDSVKDEVLRALSILHNGDPNSDDRIPLVHGDVLRENILVPRNPDQATPVQLVGFRWSGRVHYAGFPCDLFLDDFRSKVEGPMANEIILPIHDQAMWVNMLSQYD